LANGRSLRASVPPEVLQDVHMRMNARIIVWSM
jgi:hypothetical protein